jgi:hypothetical protein
MAAKTATALPTFEVDKDGLKKLLGERGKGFAVTELLQNAWDEDATRVDVTLKKVDGPPAGDGEFYVELVVEDDDPEGFKDIGHAYTLFAESEKKDRADARGRFNLGEKLVVASCERATIETTTGTVRFTPEGRTMDPPTRTTGSRFWGLLRMTEDEFDAAKIVVERLIPPAGIITTFNGEEVAHRKPVREFESPVWTVFGPELKRTIRKTTVALYELAEGEAAMVYEMGIPVVATGDRWHVDVGQKVPLNMERDNVTPAWLRDLRRIVLDHAHDLLAESDSAETWVDDAMQDEEISPEAVGAAIKLRYGDKVVAHDPSDPEANKIAAAAGYTVLASRSLPKAAWANVKTAGVVKPAGQVTPSPRPYVVGQANTRRTLPESEWNEGMKRHADFAKQVADRIFGKDTNLTVEIVNDAEAMNFVATYGRGFGGSKLEYNLRRLGRKWFEDSPLAEGHLDLLIHEFGHELESDHLSREFYDALTLLGSRFTRLALEDGDFLREAAGEAVPA